MLAWVRIGAVIYRPILTHVATGSPVGLPHIQCGGGAGFSSVWGKGHVLAQDNLG